MNQIITDDLPMCNLLDKVVKWGETVTLPGNDVPNEHPTVWRRYQVGELDDGRKIRHWFNYLGMDVDYCGREVECYDEYVEIMGGA